MKITKNKLMIEKNVNIKEMNFNFKLEFTNYMYEAFDNEKSPVIAEFLRLKSEEFLNFIQSRIKINENGLYFYDTGLNYKNDGVEISEITATIYNVIYNDSQIIIIGKGKFKIEGEPDERTLELIEGDLSLAIDNNIKIVLPNNPKYKGTSVVKIRR